jgi:hypothetical protein
MVGYAGCGSGPAALEVLSNPSVIEAITPLR